MTTQSPRLPRYKRAVIPPAMQLTERDELIISWVYEMRFCTQEHIQALLFSPGAKSSCKSRLTLLYHNGYIDRRYLPLRSAFGSSLAVYCLDRRGAELLRHRQKTGAAALRWSPQDNNRELYFLEHMVASNSFRVRATLSASGLGCNLTWTEERELRSEALKQVVTDPKRRGQRMAVIPDGHFVLERDRKTQAFALELDRSTVEERPFKEKIRALSEWKVTGAYKRVFGNHSLRVLFVVSNTRRDPHRLQRIKAWTEAEGGESLFWFADLEETASDALFTSPIWQIAGRSGRFALLET